MRVWKLRLVLHDEEGGSVLQASWALEMNTAIRLWSDARQWIQSTIEWRDGQEDV